MSALQDHQLVLQAVLIEDGQSGREASRTPSNNSSWLVVTG